MELRKLGDGPEVGALGFGCMGMSEFYGETDDAQSLATLAHAFDRGVTLFAEIRDRNVRRLARLTDGRVVAGSSPKGNIYSFPAAGGAPLLLQENRDAEVVDLLPSDDGGFHAAFVFTPGDALRLERVVDAHCLGAERRVGAETRVAFDPRPGVRVHAVIGRTRGGRRGALGFLLLLALRRRAGIDLRQLGLRRADVDGRLRHGLAIALGVRLGETPLGVLEHGFALGQGFRYQAELVLLQVAQASMDHLGGGRRRGAGEVVPLDQDYRQAPAGGVAGDARAVDAAADDEEIVGRGGHGGAL